MFPPTAFSATSDVPGHDRLVLEILGQHLQEGEELVVPPCAAHDVEGVRPLVVDGGLIAGAQRASPLGRRSLDARLEIDVEDAAAPALDLVEVGLLPVGRLDEERAGVLGDSTNQ
jgi:hypothetical protein